MSYEPYKEQDFKLPSMKGFSERQIDEHLKLYAGYVKNVNGLASDMRELAGDPEKNMRALSELQRRLAFEWNGMRMHEYYFEAMGGTGAQTGSESSLTQALEKKFGSFDAWASEFKAIGTMRGIGWVVLVHDTHTNTPFSIWVNDHEIGHLAGAPVILAMDVWEHAYLLDYLPGGRKDYIDAFFEVLKWDVLEDRFTKALQN